jgi:hypothetical protein
MHDLACHCGNRLTVREGVTAQAGERIAKAHPRWTETMPVAS